MNIVKSGDLYCLKLLPSFLLLQVLVDKSLGIIEIKFRIKGEKSDKKSEQLSFLLVFHIFNNSK